MKNQRLPHDLSEREDDTFRIQQAVPQDIKYTKEENETLGELSQL